MALYYQAEFLQCESKNCTERSQIVSSWRDDVVDLVDCYQYEDNQVNDMDAFAREPYVLRFKPHNTGPSTTLEINLSI